MLKSRVKPQETFTGPRDAWEIIWSVIEYSMTSENYLMTQDEKDQLKKAYGEIYDTEVR